MPLGDILQYLESFLVVTVGEGTPGIYWVEARGATRHPTAYRTPHNKNIIMPQVSSCHCGETLQSEIYQGPSRSKIPPFVCSSKVCYGPGSEQDRVPALSGPAGEEDNDNRSSWLSANYRLSSLHKLSLSILTKTPPPILQMKKLGLNEVKKLRPHS